jgi:iron(III) transport system permease protein
MNVIDSKKLSIMSSREVVPASRHHALPSRPPGWYPSGETVLLAALAVYVGVFAVWPLTRLLMEAAAPSASGEPFGVLLRQWQSVATRRALWNTLEASLLSTLVSVVFGGAAAAVLTLSDVRAKPALTFVLLLPLLIPPQIIALAWIELAGPSSPILNAVGLAPEPGSTNPLYSRWGVVLVMGVEHSTLAFLAIRAGLRSLPRDLVEAARLGGAGPGRVTRSVILPLAWPSLLAGAVLAFLSSIGNFGIPALLGIPGRYPVLTTLIYQRLQGFGPRVLGEVAALALILAALAFAGLLLRAALARRTGGAAEGAGPPFEPFGLGRWRPLVELGLWSAVAAVAILPLLALIAGSLAPALGLPLRPETATLAHYRFVLLEQEATLRAFRNSFVLAAAAAFISAVVAAPLAYASVMQRRRLARALDAVADAPYAVPGTVLAIAVILVFLPPLPLIGVSLYGTLWLILAAYLARFLALALRPAVAGIELVDRKLDEAAQVAGARVLTRLRAVILPMIAPSLAAGGLLVFMTAFNELTVSALLWSTGRETLGVVVFFLHYEGNSPAAAALATVSVAVTLGLAFLVSLLGRNLPEGVVPWRA